MSEVSLFVSEDEGSEKGFKRPPAPDALTIFDIKHKLTGLRAERLTFSLTEMTQKMSLVGFYLKIPSC